ncbi:MULTISPECIES: ferric-rhodotorulic acid/ferric-coprogen receptor FhuE [Erwinia]|uniref:Ferric-rhodotorulic acid/ferric-coprogen receptor FhuE n=1 Tax=Erwinia rhapontici TaxID=55212 RepID=A0ABN6DJW1_ERWRD|nr:MULTISPECIES: ferric-rhodotorulic acid/ferric-coprogen receptor FhuE [Erwinia]MBP2155877.1 outer membrane receptor for ferric coprogen and ferric-rhodotorulic acid [Erwinia rhapontici]NNS05714.1 ferric-rhodotorulic acid/ferric-coprogen receptor FhuE [Erwinia sp. JH02]BCQ35023.1 ferric-rhodotorulic acid/ferric-coprogen receptor FhuE [Erwinia rhapontici]BCQ45119.1 ferric-rhodotorulic acid/ferric-coprogen receptor FhuE [Erwinia rhapontici]
MSSRTFSSHTRGKGSPLRVPGQKTTLSVSLLALMIHALVNPAMAQEAASPQEMVVDATADDTAASEKQDYTVKTTRAGTKMLMTPRDVPQSLSVVTEQRMLDQNLQTVGEVLDNTTGIATQLVDSERSSYFSRGFQITNYTFDDIPTSAADNWNYGDAGEDTAIYDRIEVVRGATGLMSGAGSPSASVNMVRKHADSKTVTGNLSASYGRWNTQRYVADLSAPLNEEGTVRGRVIAGYQDQDGWLDRYHKSKKFLYGVLDADVTDNTTVSLGYDYQESNTGNPTWGGLPTWYSNGSRTHYSRNLNPSADWTRYSLDSRKVFANVKHDFDNGWTFRVNATHAEQTFADKLLYVMEFPDAVTGTGVSGYGSLDRGKRTQESIDTYASGPFELLGRNHELMAGVSYSRQHNQTYSVDGALDYAQMGSFDNNWNGNVQEPEWGDWYLNADDVIRQKSAYTAARFSLADPLSLILGARYTQWSTVGSSGNMNKNNITPYGGLVYDIDDTWSAYASYTSIFQPQTYRSTDGAYLSPVTGKNYETGLKSDWFDGRLTATFAVFRIEQENVGQELSGTFVNGSSEQAYVAAKGAVSKGAEFELNGAVTDNLQMTFGATRYVARDTSGRFNSNMPQTSFKLFSRYRLPMLQDLTIGGGLNWQNRTFQDATGPDGEVQRVYQGSYPLANLFARYQFTKQLAVQANVDNLFDRSYYSWGSDYVVYGEPRSYSVNLSYAF